jgi:hypothetical protein
LNTHDPEFDASVDELSPTDATVPGAGSLTDDVVAMLDDGRTLLEAEIQFQKTRAAFALDRGKAGAIYGVASFALIHLALVALVVGAVIGLTPVIGPWGATAVVAGLLLIAGAFLGLAARRRFARLASVYAETRE